MPRTLFCVPQTPAPHSQLLSAGLQLAGWKPQGGAFSSSSFPEQDEPSCSMWSSPCFMSDQGSSWGHSPCQWPCPGPQTGCALTFWEGDSEGVPGWNVLTESSIWCPRDMCSAFRCAYKARPGVADFVSYPGIQVWVGSILLKFPGVVVFWVPLGRKGLGSGGRGA